MSSPYKIYKSTKGGYYSFKTKNEITYRCFFTQSKGDNDLLGLKLKNPVYFFLFNKKKNNGNTAYDRLVSITVAQLLTRFFEKNPRAIIAYICENSDSKAIKRQYSFDKWFRSNNVAPKKTLIKGEISGVIYAGVIAVEGHPELKKIRTYFQQQVKEITEAQKSGSVEIIQ